MFPNVSHFCTSAATAFSFAHCGFSVEWFLAGEGVWTWKVLQRLPAKYVGDLEGARGRNHCDGEEENPNSCNLCTLVFHIHFRKGSSL